MSILKIPWSATREQSNQLRQNAKEILAVRGDGTTPNPPRSLQAQPGSRKIMLTWCSDPTNGPGVRARIYKNTEKDLYTQLAAGVNNCDVNVPVGAVVNIFVSFIQPNGIGESKKVWCQSSALAEAGAPVDPPPPAGHSDEPTGGGGERRTGLPRGYNPL
jgi:hypothetical protein